MRVEDMMPASDAYEIAAVHNAIILRDFNEYDINPLATYCYERIIRAADAGYFYCDVKHPLFANADVVSKIRKAFRELGYHALAYNPVFVCNVTQKYEQFKPNGTDPMIRFVWDEEYATNQK